MTFFSRMLHSARNRHRFRQGKSPNICSIVNCEVTTLRDLGVTLSQYPAWYKHPRVLFVTGPHRIRFSISGSITFQSCAERHYWGQRAARLVAVGYTTP